MIYRFADGFELTREMLVQVVPAYADADCIDGSSARVVLNQLMGWDGTYKGPVLPKIFSPEDKALAVQARLAELPYWPYGSYLAAWYFIQAGRLSDAHSLLTELHERVPRGYGFSRCWPRRIELQQRGSMPPGTLSRDIAGIPWPAATPPEWTTHKKAPHPDTVAPISWHLGYHLCKSAPDSEEAVVRATLPIQHRPKDEWTQGVATYPDLNAVIYGHNPLGAPQRDLDLVVRRLREPCEPWARARLLLRLADQFMEPRWTMAAFMAWAEVLRIPSAPVYYARYAASAIRNRLAL